MVLVGFLPILGGALGLGGAVGSIFAGRGAERRARGMEREALQIGRQARRRSERGFRSAADLRRGHIGVDPDQMARRAAMQSRIASEALTREMLPQFEQQLEESVGSVVGGLGRRGGLVGETVGRASDRLAQSIANLSTGMLPQFIGLSQADADRALRLFGLESGLARQDEDVLLSILGEVAGAEQGRANAARRGFAGLAGLGGNMMLASAFL